MEVDPFMPAYLEFSIDKFNFQTATDRYYNDEGVWAKLENNRVRIGISDFLQQRSGDVAFVELKPVGTQVAFRDEIAVIETIKVNISLSSPITGKVIELNSAMATSPEIINEDPYQAGWLMVIEPSAWEDDRRRLLAAQDYYDKIKEEAGREKGEENERTSQ